MNIADVAISIESVNCITTSISLNLPPFFEDPVSPFKTFTGLNDER